MTAFGDVEAEVEGFEGVEHPDMLDLEVPESSSW